MKKVWQTVKEKIVPIWKNRKKRIVMLTIVITGTLLMTHCPKEGGVLIKNSDAIAEVLVELF